MTECMVCGHHDESHHFAIEVDGGIIPGAPLLTVFECPNCGSEDILDYDAIAFVEALRKAKV